MPGYSKAIIPLAAAACVACGARVTDEETAPWLDGDSVGEASQAIWQSDCNAYLDAYRSHTFDGYHPAGYDHAPSGGTGGGGPVGLSGCFKTFIKEVSSFVATALFKVSVLDADLPTTEAACTKAWGAVQLFRMDGSNWTKLTGDFDSTYRKYGTWVPASGTLAAHCSQSFAFPASLFSDQKTYRIHATMRTARYGETKPIVFKNWYYPH